MLQQLTSVLQQECKDAFLYADVSILRGYAQYELALVFDRMIVMN